ncbi:basic salivary proline-rich protein 3-like [Sphaerodactylus townsendi]|uniref:basic salivary proline-rich protein 3-like n=1 Tax=Sphaerodactylus townsendi TaxID=933632 RepID=UPI002025EEB2|nr:basic salivary proline-rich protein 3-like [Sphaerodactylus townsendi]
MPAPFGTRPGRLQGPPRLEEKPWLKPKGRGGGIPSGGFRFASEGAGGLSAAGSAAAPGFDPRGGERQRAALGHPGLDLPVAAAAPTAPPPPPWFRADGSPPHPQGQEVGGVTEFISPRTGTPPPRLEGWGGGLFSNPRRASVPLPPTASGNSATCGWSREGCEAGQSRPNGLQSCQARPAALPDKLPLPHTKKNICFRAGGLPQRPVVQASTPPPHFADAERTVPRVHRSTVFIFLF